MIKLRSKAAAWNKDIRKVGDWTSLAVFVVSACAFPVLLSSTLMLQHFEYYFGPLSSSQFVFIFVPFNAPSYHLYIDPFSQHNYHIHTIENWNEIVFIYLTNMMWISWLCTVPCQLSSQSGQLLEWLSHTVIRLYIDLFVTYPNNTVLKSEDIT